MGHINNLGQQCEGQLCIHCTRCSNCRYQKPGQYKRHEHEFGVSRAHIQRPEPEKKPEKKASRSRSRRGAIV